MTRSKAPSHGDRHGSPGTPVGVGHRTRQEHPVPELTDGKVRCPVCRNAVTTTGPLGLLRKHKDVFGNQCYNKRPDGATSGVTAPPVTLPAVKPDPVPRQRVRVERGDSSRIVTGYCHTCDKQIGAGRQFCGLCLAKRGTL